MIVGLLVALVVMEFTRLMLNIRDSRRISRINEGVTEQREKVLEFEMKRDAEWKEIRRLEIEELRHLAKESDTMKEIYDEYKEVHKEEK